MLCFITVQKASVWHDFLETPPRRNCSETPNWWGACIKIMLRMKKKNPAIPHRPVNMQITSHFHRTAKRVSQCETVYNLNAKHYTKRQQSIETTHSKWWCHVKEPSTTFLFLVVSHCKCNLMSSECIGMTFILIFSCAARGVLFK